MDFEKALKPIWDDLVRYARALTGTREMADDLLQDSLLRAWKAWPQLRDQTSVKPWMLHIIRNTYRSTLRLRWVKRLVGLESASSIPAPEELSYDEKEVVRLSFQVLPFHQREALILYEVLGQSVAEVAILQKVTVSAVKSRLARGRAKLLERYLVLSEPANVAKAGTPTPIPIPTTSPLANGGSSSHG